MSFERRPAFLTTLLSVDIGRTSRGMEALIDANHLSAELCTSSHFKGPWPLKDTTRNLVYPARASGHDKHAIRQEHSLRDGVGHKQDGLVFPCCPPNSQQFEIHFIARHGIKSPKGLIH